jgi:S-adenosylmethionine hydrolase
MKKLIVIADWAADSLTCQEYRTVVEGFSQNPQTLNLSFVASTPSTLHTAFLLEQLVEVEERFGRPLETVFFVNTDPRIHSTVGVEKAKGADFFVLKLHSGVTVCGPNAQYVFSLIKDKIKVSFIYQDLDKGSQFRSRDLYSRVCAHLADNLDDQLGLEEVHNFFIADIKGYYILHIDNFGNIKTNLTAADFKGKYEINDEVKITINQVEKKAIYVSNLFGGKPGQLVIYPGSSGKKNNPYLEISIWRHFTEKNPTTGKDEFNFPQPGAPLKITGF